MFNLNQGNHMKNNCGFRPEHVKGLTEEFHCPVCHEMQTPGEAHTDKQASDFDFHDALYEKDKHVG